MIRWKIIISVVLISISIECVAHSNNATPRVAYEKASHSTLNLKNDEMIEKKIAHTLLKFNHEVGIEASEDISVELGMLFVQQPRVFVKTAIHLDYSSQQVASFVTSLSPDYVDMPCKRSRELNRREQLLLSIKDNRMRIIEIDKPVREAIELITKHCPKNDG